MGWGPPRRDPGTKETARKPMPAQLRRAPTNPSTTMTQNRRHWFNGHPACSPVPRGRRTVAVAPIPSPAPGHGDPPNGGRRLSVMAKNFIIRTFGCQMNEHDSERLAGMLVADGMQQTDDLQQADVVVLNTCCIRENADQKL